MKPDRAGKSRKARMTGEWNMPPEQQAHDTAPGTDKSSLLAALKDKAMACRSCSLYSTAQNLVFSDGPADTPLVIVGEAPGADEDMQGKPFVGRAGRLLTAALAEAGLPRACVYICNILKHRPPDNRNPAKDEISACTPFLVRQLAIIRPALIITLGNFSSRYLLSTDEGITRLRGSFHTNPAGYRVLPVLHPAAVLRNPGNLPLFKADIRLGIETLVCEGLLKLPAAPVA